MHEGTASYLADMRDFKLASI